jgi:S-(hydroxymethyl)glutathione dehydrogenase/alcohol dehydrogenase
MKAALLKEIGAPLVVADIHPEPLEYGQVFVRVICSGICGAQLQEIDGKKTGGPLPHPLGHEGCGEVERVGLGVRLVKPGDKVVMHWRKGDGIEAPFPKYRYGDKVITGGRVTTFSEYSICSENRLTPIPNHVPERFAAMLGCGLSTALGTIENEAKLQIGETILIIGCGGLGLNLILAANLRQASYIGAVDLVPGKKEVAFSMGAVGFNAPEGSNYDVIVDTTGEPSAIEEYLPMLAPSGRFIMVGQPRPNADVLIKNARHFFDGEGKTIKATQGGCFNPSKDIPRYIRAYDTGRINLGRSLSHRLKLDEINQGIDLVRNGQAGRVMIEP